PLHCIFERGVVSSVDVLINMSLVGYIPCPPTTGLLGTRHRRTSCKGQDVQQQDSKFLLHDRSLDLNSFDERYAASRSSDGRSIENPQNCSYSLSHGHRDGSELICSYTIHPDNRIAATEKIFKR